MTLLVYAKGNDGFVILSDRKESEYKGQGNEVRKYYLPKNKEFFLSLAGDGTTAKALFSYLDTSENVNSTNIISTIQNFTSSIYAELQKPGQTKGFLVKDQNHEILYIINIVKNRLITSKNDSYFFTIGDVEAKTIIEHLIRNINFKNLPCDDVAKHILAAVSDIAQTVTSVGTMEKFGFDVTAFMNTGEIWQRKRYTDLGNKLKILFELDNEIILCGENKDE